jgi:hypothetical protein
MSIFWIFLSIRMKEKRKGQSSTKPSRLSKYLASLDSNQVFAGDDGQYGNLSGNTSGRP